MVFQVAPMRITRFRATLALFGLMSLVSCERQNQVVHREAVAAPGQHWMQGEQIKKVMGQLAGIKEAFPKGLPEDAESPAGVQARLALAEAEAVANALAETARSIPATVANKPMSDTDRRGFTAEAARLGQQAIALRDAARAHQIEPLQGLLDNINATCISCHSHYRDLTGEINAHKASAPTLDPNPTASVENGSPIRP